MSVGVIFSMVTCSLALLSSMTLETVLPSLAPLPLRLQRWGCEGGEVGV